MSAGERTELLKDLLRNDNLTGIIECIKVIRLKDVIKKKFESANFTAKEELPLSLFSRLPSHFFLVDTNSQKLKVD